ncbi:MAG TPA: signal recognition particle receptor subunit alpha, partial [Spirochaetota bacterium]|nr:signal recognition particle receptor subunit alpha [Spirochaetota bacterium]
MLDVLTDKISGVFAKLGRRKRLTEANIKEGIREIRLALIEADANITAIKSFINRVRAKALGTEVLAAVSPVQMFTKIVHESLVEFFGGSQVAPLTLAEPTRVSTVLMSGLQGSGKTTTCAKLAYRFRDKRDILLVSLDIHRPAANEQLKILSEQAGVAFFDRGTEQDLKKIIKAAFKYASKNVHNMIIFDTAGRTQIDQTMLDELKLIYKYVKPVENILVCDSMTGQQALSVASEFKQNVPLTSLIFTKFDSDTRGGAALSVKHVVGAPIKYIGTGEGVSQFDEFAPARIADRVLGMGDVVGLVQKAEASLDKEKNEKLAEKLSRKEFDLQLFLDQLQQMNKLGSMQSLLGMLPGMSQKLKNVNIDESQ